MEFSKRTQLFGDNIFSELEVIRKRRIELGSDVINLSVGTPDFEPPKHVMQEFIKSGEDPNNYKYSLMELPELISAVQSWYKRRYGVELDSDEVAAAHGSQEGIFNIPLILCDEGDIVLVPNPGYPIFGVGPLLAGAKLVKYPLTEANDYLIDFDSIDKDTAKKAKAIIVSYPNNPTTAVAPYEFYVKLVEFAKEYDLIVIHDNAYSELVYDTAPAMSFLSVPGARDIGVEFNSLSKSYNLTGLRISFCVGNREIIKRFKTLKSQIDYGIPYPVQYAAISALNGDQSVLCANRERYKKRRDVLCGGLEKLGLNVKYAPATMFVWCGIHENYESSMDFCKALIENTGVICVPGESFGSLGNKYVRFAMVQDIQTINHAIELMNNYFSKL